MGDDDWVDKAEEERLGIIAKYDKGREEGAEIEPWDDPAFEIYHVTDHYGFIHDQRFPLKFNPEETKLRLTEAERADKWIKMHANWEKFRHSEKLRTRTFKGIPNKVRGLFWGLYLDLPTIKEQQKGKYEEMYQLARLHSLDVRQIDLDVNRTYRDNIMFRERYGVKQRSLFNILCAYSIYNSEVGYCQGMSQVAALLLTYMDEEDAFWGLSQLMTHHKYGMHGFFIAGFPKLVRYQKHHDKILKTMIPKLKKHFDKHGVDVGLYTLKWFFQCFLDRVPFELALRLWDVFLMDGDKVLTCAAYTILKIHQKQLLARKNMDDLLDYLQTAIPSDLTIDIDKAIQTYQRCVEDLHRKKLDTAGEPTEDELPKKPFGLIENISKPVPIRKEVRNLKQVAPLPIPPPQEHKEISGSEGEEEEEDEDEDEEKSEKASASRDPTGTSAASSSVANSPRSFSRPLSSVSNFSYASAIEDYNSSKKSTPLKVNGVNSSKPKTVGHGDNEPIISSKRDAFFGKQEHKIGNGSVEKMESIEFMENQLVINVSDQYIKYSEGIHTNQKEGRFSSENIVITNKNPPPPPVRSTDANRHNTTIGSSTATPKAESSHNGRKSINNSNSATDRSPRKSNDHPTMSPNSDKSRWSPSSINIPSGEAVRIHVPYSNSNDISTIPVKPSPGATRSNFDTLKNDPNRIKIDISSK